MEEKRGQEVIFKNLWKELKKKYKVKKEFICLSIIFDKDKSITISYEFNAFIISMYSEELKKEVGYVSGNGVRFWHDGTIWNWKPPKNLEWHFNKANELYSKDKKFVKFHKEICKEVKTFLTPNSIKFINSL